MPASVKVMHYYLFISFFYFCLEILLPCNNVDIFIKILIIIICIVMKRIYFLAILIIPIFLGSCNVANETDHSLTLEAYRELGIPDPGKVWNFQDYITTYAALLNLKLEKPYALPVKNSRRSGELFYRMISLENLSFLEDESLPLHEKAHRIKGFVNVYNDLIELYTNVLMKKQYYNPELVEIWIFGLGVTQKMLDLAEKINKSDVPADRRMASGYKSIQGIYLTGLMEVLRQQQYTSQYPVRDLELLTDSLSISVQRNMEWFDEDTSEQIKQAMRAVIDSTSSLKIKNDYLELIEIL